MDYKIKYTDALEGIRELYNSNCDMIRVKRLRRQLEHIFPELKESKDEKIKREIVAYINELADLKNEKIPTKWLDWLEKQGEKKPTDEVEPKFKVGDWIIFNGSILHIDEVVNGYYRTTSRGDGIHNSYDWDIDNAARLWTIQEAKDGDVLAYVTDEDLWIMIYRSLYEPYEGHVHYHALLVNDNFSDKGTCCICIDNLKPATKEQRKLLFQKMKEAGYEWDADKKELKKIELKKLDADKVIEWLKPLHHGYIIDGIINKFKEDFGLC